jgi:5-methylcytosine-specific restriction endonuclease McrA
VKARTICSVPGCPHALPCPEHPARIGSKYRWRKLKAAALTRSRGLCVRCGRPATSVHHVRPVSLGGPLLPPVEELEPVCDDCRPVADAEALREARHRRRRAARSGR